MSEPALQPALIPVPHGWSYVDEEDLPSIERHIGDYTLTIGLDEFWHWWIYPKGQLWPVHAHGRSNDQLHAIWSALDALDKVMNEASFPTSSPPGFQNAKVV